MPELIDDKKAQAAQDDEHGHDQVDRDVARVGLETRHPSAQNVEAGIAEGAYARENAVPDSLASRHVVKEAEGEEQGSQSFADDHRGCDEAGETAGIAVRWCGDALAKVTGLAHAEPRVPKGGHEHRRQDHVAESTNLDEQEDHHLTGRRPEGTGIKDDEARHAGGTGSCEEGPEKTGVDAGVRLWQKKEEGSDKNDDREAQQNALSRTCRHELLEKSGSPLLRSGHHCHVLPWLFTSKSIPPRELHATSSSPVSLFPSFPPSMLIQYEGCFPRVLLSKARGASHEPKDVFSRALFPNARGALVSEGVLHVGVMRPSMLVQCEGCF